MPQDIINHVAFVLDGSSSMSPHAMTVPEVFDAQVKALAESSDGWHQETRVTTYIFGSVVPKPIYYDKDVKHLPSIRGKYHIGGMTALNDAICKAVDDLSRTATLYGNHAFLVYVLTDGEENRSHNSADDVRSRVLYRRGNWTFAAFVPSSGDGRWQMDRYGFDPSNVETWNPSERGELERVGRTIQASTQVYMSARSTGQTQVGSLFQADPVAVPNAIQMGVLTALPGWMHKVITITKSSDGDSIREFIQRFYGPYTPGMAYYQLTKKTLIRPGRDVLVRKKGEKIVWGGKDARQVLGLPDDRNITVNPATRSEWDIFVKSTSHNRKLVAGTDLIIID